MPRTHVAFLRAISNVPMAPFRAALEELRLADVDTFGGTGNLMFSGVPEGLSITDLESLIAERTGALAFVRTRRQLAGIVAHDPFAGHEGAGILLTRRPLTPRQRAILSETAFEGERPQFRGAEVYFVWPTHREGWKDMFDFERELGTQGTMRAPRVLARVLALM